MAQQLKIETYSAGMELYVGCISKMQLTALEKACPTVLGIYRKKALHRIWYHNPKVMQAIFGVNSWKYICLPKHHYYGPLLPNKTELRDLLNKVEVFLDEQAVKIDTRQIKCQFKPARPLPVLKMDQVAVCHGEYYTGHTAFIHESISTFSLKKLKLVFVECGANGHILSKIRYADQVLYPQEQTLEKEKLNLQFIARQ